MAGVPDIGWRRSLDRCSANPSTTYLALNRDLYYREIYGLPLPEAQKLIEAYSPAPRLLELVSARLDTATKDESGTEPKACER